MKQIEALNWSEASTQRVTKEQEAILRQPLDPDWVEVKYPNIPYVPVAYYRKVLNDAFGPGGWALVEIGRVRPVPMDKKFNKQSVMYFLPAVLVVEGRPIYKTVGEFELLGDNDSVSDGDALEACRSNAITRAGGKGLGIAEEIHWAAWTRKWLREYCRELGKTNKGVPILARKDDEAGADLFIRRMENEDIYRGRKSYEEGTEDHIASIQEED
jgi:hypothetical protein